MRSRTALACFLPAVLLLLAGPVVAGEPRTHDGFFLRLSGGVGYGSTSRTLPSGIVGNPQTAELAFDGLDGDYNFAVGGMIARNLALHGTFFGWSIADPDVEVDGTKTGSLDGNLSLSAMGGGVTYYIMPANIYFSGSLGLAWLSEEIETDVGFGLDATIGKEWWVGGSWGLGLAGAFGYHSVPDDLFDENWSGVSFGLRFSATLN